MTTAKNDNYNLKIFIYFGGGDFLTFGGEGIKIWWEGIFPGGGGDDQIFGWWEGTPPSPQ